MADMSGKKEPVKETKWIKVYRVEGKGLRYELALPL